MHKTANVTLAAAVASGGTFTLSYPDGTSANDFAGYGHYMFSRGLQARFSQDAGTMSVAFTTTITVTYTGSTSIPAGSVVAVELNMAGADDAPADIVAGKRIVYDPLLRMDLGTPDAADPNGIVESQDLTALGVYSVLAFNGVYGDPYGNEYAVLDVPRALVASWTTAALLTVTGEDEYGDVIVETSAAGATTLVGKKAFKKITDISTSVDITSLTVGTSDILGLPVYVEKVDQIIAELQDGVQLAKFGNGKILIPFDFNETDLLAPTAQNLVAPCAGYITGIQAIVQGAVTTGGDITVEANTVAVVGLSVTIDDGAAAGVVYTDSVLKIATGLVAAGDDLTVTPAAAIDTAGAVKGHLIFEPIAGVNGTFVAGDQTAPTAVTGDVRGTYDPAEACDASLGFQLIAVAPDPAYRGVDNYDG